MRTRPKNKRMCILDSKRVLTEYSTTDYWYLKHTILFTLDNDASIKKHQIQATMQIVQSTYPTERVLSQEPPQI